MSSVGRVMSGVAGRLPARPHKRGDDYAFCPEDNFWFRPSYTEGKCPLCGVAAPSGAPTLPLLRRMDRSWFGLAALAIESFAMLTLVMFMYFKG
jgi:hypothetical protein